MAMIIVSALQPPESALACRRAPAGSHQPSPAGRRCAWASRRSGALPALRPECHQWASLPGFLRGRRRRLNRDSPTVDDSCTHRQVVGSLLPSRLQIHLLSLLVGGLAAASASLAQPRATPTDTIGRLQSVARSCSSNLAAAAQAPCTSVQFEQQDGLLNVRFISPGQRGGESDQLSFVGTLQPGSVPMACQQGRCQFQGAISTAIASVSERSFDSRGLVKALPKAWPANGSCRIDQRQVRCEAKALSRELWSATATF